MSLLQTPSVEGEKILDMGSGGNSAFVARTTDPNVLPQPYASPADFAAQYPQPLDTTEIIAMCGEITALQVLRHELVDHDLIIGYIAHITLTAVIVRRPLASFEEIEAHSCPKGLRLTVCQFHFCLILRPK